MARLRELAHTADIGFEATAASPEELFEAAARGLVQALGLEPAGASGGAAVDVDELEISRPDGERLLVEWLRELLAGAMSGRGVPAADVDEVALPDGDAPFLRARVRWRPAAGEGPGREIKGVTYHGLVVERRDDGRWHARVVLDV